MLWHPSSCPHVFQLSTKETSIIVQMACEKISLRIAKKPLALGQGDESPKIITKICRPT